MVSSADLHIVCFNVPWPANYGGVIDSFYRIEALARMGLKIDLHCFTKNRAPAVELSHLCRQVFYYKRRPALLGLLGGEPYIVSSRTSVTLHNRLISDNSPILFDGLHTSWYLNDPQLEQRRKVVRMHNVEWEYYAGLAKIERDMLRGLYFQVESRRLRKYEKVLSQAHGIACISPADTAYYQNLFGKKAEFIPAFHPFQQVIFPGIVNELGKERKYALYHGNLSVGENVQAASWLIGNVFNDLDIPLFIAGMDPDYKLYDLAKKHDHITLIPDPSEQEMDTLIHEAHLHVLPTFQSTGIKLKLLRALFNGRFVLVNPDMVLQTGLEKWTITEDSAEDWKARIKLLMQREYGIAEHEARDGLAAEWSNQKSGQQLVNMIYST
ncbi:MAG: hypothetical protein ACI959_001797 [Limisphaerales bacterium]|jgi:hypothetical protein